MVALSVHMSLVVSALQGGEVALPGSGEKAVEPNEETYQMITSWPILNHLPPNIASFLSILQK